MMMMMMMMMMMIMGLQSLSFHYDSEIRDKERYETPKIDFRLLGS